MQSSLFGARTFGAASAFLGLAVMMASQQPTAAEIGLGLCALATFSVTWMLGRSAPKPLVPSPVPAAPESAPSSVDAIVTEAYRLRSIDSGSRTHPALMAGVQSAPAGR
jgi:hypothetical protein